jgi:hypothetical protein
MTGEERRTSCAAGVTVQREPDRHAHSSSRTGRPDGGWPEGGSLAVVSALSAAKARGGEGGSSVACPSVDGDCSNGRGCTGKAGFYSCPRRRFAPGQSCAPAAPNPGRGACPPSAPSCVERAPTKQAKPGCIGSLPSDALHERAAEFQERSGHPDRQPPPRAGRARLGAPGLGA